MFRYTGRFGDDDSTPGQDIVSQIARADIAYIDDPLSFPWELLDDAALSCPLAIDLSGCDPDALVALRPAIPVLTEYDTITKRDDPAGPIAARFAHLVGAAHGSAADLDASGGEAKALKTMQMSEERILRRTRREWQTLVVDFDDIVSIDWLTTDWTDAEDLRPPALAVRISGKTLRSVPAGFETFVRLLVTTTASSSVLGIWGIRDVPGAPVDRSVVVLSRPAS